MDDEIMEENNMDNSNTNKLGIILIDFLKE